MTSVEGKRSITELFNLYPMWNIQDSSSWGIVKSEEIDPPFPWRLGNPPSKGEYLVTQKTEGEPAVLMLHWDGHQWQEFCSLEGAGVASNTKYYPVMAWMFLPSCYQPHEATS